MSEKDFWEGVRFFLMLGLVMTAPFLMEAGCRTVAAAVAWLERKAGGPRE